MTAIYARQSVEKADSISIETQVRACVQRLPRGEKYEVFADRGWSGATNRRPALERMMQAVHEGRFSCIAVYKLDRLGRSLRHFLELLDELNGRNVTLMTESVTLGGADAYGKMLAGLMMSFAELERDTIIRRVTDNYYERGRNGMFLGGSAPFGLMRAEYRRDGRSIKGFTAQPEQAALVRQMYERYVRDNISLGHLAQELNRQKIVTARGNPWSSASVGRLLHNPVYVRADALVYRYFKGAGSKVTSPPEAFDGQHGLYLYGTAKGRSATKYADYRALTVSIAPHEGIVGSVLWLGCQRKLKSNRTLNGRDSATWLNGLVHCTHCGYACSVTGRGKQVRYLTCGGRKMGVCPKKSRPLTAEEVEEAIYRYLWGEVRRLSQLPEPSESRRQELEYEKERCLNALIRSETAAEALEQRLCALEQEQKAIDSAQCDAWQAKQLLFGFPERWKHMDFRARRTIVGIFVCDIRVSEEEIRIVGR